MLKCLILVLTFTCTSSFAQGEEGSPVIQRYAVVGASDDGKRLAVILTHFGPSSGAPFANVFVFESGKAEPLFKDGLFMMEGNESNLASIAAILFAKNKVNLKALGIEVDSPVYGDANYIVQSPGSQNSIHGQIDIESVGIKNFSIESGKSSVVLRLEKNHISIDPQDHSEYASGPIQLRTIIRTKSVAWFFWLKPEDTLGIPFYTVNVAGLSWE